MKKLWKHQEDAVEKARFSDNLALFFEMGTGKTATIIKILEEEYRKNTIQNTLIFAPLSVCKQWKSEFAKFSEIEQYRILVLTGTGSKRTKELKQFVEAGVPCIVVTNYEAVGIADFYNLLLKFSPSILVCDESQRLKNHSASRSKKIFPLALAAKRRFIMTGTPVLNNLMDIFGQFKILDSNVFGCNYWAFRNQYFYDANSSWSGKQGYFPNWVPKADAAKKIGETIGSVSLQAKKEDCLDLPPLVKVQVPCDISSKQQAQYNMMEKHFVAELNGVTSIAPLAMTKALRLQQILGGFIASDNQEVDAQWFEDVPRLKTLEELLEGIGDEKTIIWTIFKPTYAKIAQVCKKLGRSVAFLTGEQSTVEKEASIEHFCRGDVNTLISNPSAGGVGVNLTESKYSIYFMKSYSLEQYLQSEARNYRAGTSHSVTHYHIYAPDTIDEAINKALMNKQDVAEALLKWAKKNFTKQE